MPELPEVETIRRQLIPSIKGKRISRILLHTPSLLKNCNPAEFVEKLRDRTVLDLQRKGKFLIFDCNENLLVFHLGMSGIFLTRKNDSRYPQHIHLSLQFYSGENLYFQDVRKFGKIFLAGRPFNPKNLGTDPFDKKFTLHNFNKLINLSKKNIKQFLMEQSNVAGIGNIYANEILFRAGVSPFARCDELTSRQIRGLYRQILSVLNDAIERFGTTYSAYRTVDGNAGQNQHFLQVYQRKGAPCSRCRKPIQKTYLANRSTFYCTVCQKK